MDMLLYILAGFGLLALWVCFKEGYDNSCADKKNILCYLKQLFESDKQRNTELEFMNFDIKSIKETTLCIYDLIVREKNGGK
jgi:hypothetical protein